MTPSIKLRILIGGILLAFVISYQLALKKTIQLRNEVSVSENELVALGNPMEQLATLKHKNRYYDSILAAHSFNSNSIQNNLLLALNRAADSQKVIVRDFNPPHIYNSETAEVFNYRFTLRGGYRELLRVIHSLEQNGSFGAVNHMDFELMQDYRRRKSFLEAQVYLRQTK